MNTSRPRRRTLSRVTLPSRRPSSSRSIVMGFSGSAGPSSCASTVAARAATHIPRIAAALDGWSDSIRSFRTCGRRRHTKAPNECAALAERPCVAVRHRPVADRGRKNPSPRGAPPQFPRRQTRSSRAVFYMSRRCLATPRDIDQPTHRVGHAPRLRLPRRPAESQPVEESGFRHHDGSHAEFLFLEQGAEFVAVDQVDRQMSFRAGELRTRVGP